MTLYIDDLQEYPDEMIAPAARKYGRRWAHLWADSLEELHAFAVGELHLSRSWFQKRASLPHYDLTPNKWSDAMLKGYGRIEHISLHEYFRRQKMNGVAS